MYENNIYEHYLPIMVYCVLQIHTERRYDAIRGIWVSLEIIDQNWNSIVILKIYIYHVLPSVYTKIILNLVIRVIAPNYTHWSNLVIRATAPKLYSLVF